jgi:serine/threonine-protein kinase
MSTDTPFSLEDVRKFLQRKRGHSHFDDQETAPKAQQQDAMEQPIVGYRMLEKLGSGGMAAVFKAEHISSGEIVALKLLYPHHDKKTLKQFLHEGMILMRLDHPHILKGFDFGISTSFYFLALEFVEGESLVTFLDKGFFFTERYALQITLQIAIALAYLERKGIVHRDVKPANILTIADSVKLCDFALALDIKAHREEESETTCGTMEYIAPEQARGDPNLGSRTDVYSLGITCMQMITGQLPFHGDSPQEIMRQHIYEPIDWRQFAKISLPVQTVIKMMVAKKPEKRLHASKLVPVLQKLLQQMPN